MIIRPEHIPVLSNKLESRGELLVLLKFMAHADESTGHTYPTADDIAASTGFKLRYVRKCISSLKEIGLIKDVGRCKYRWRLKKRMVDIPCESTLSCQDTIESSLPCPPGTPYTLSPQDTPINTIIKQSHKKKYIKKNNQRRIKESLVTQSYDGDI